MVVWSPVSIGPVIGKTDDVSTRILIEVNADVDVTCCLTKRGTNIGMHVCRRVYVHLFDQHKSHVVCDLVVSSTNSLKTNPAYPGRFTQGVCVSRS